MPRGNRFAGAFDDGIITRPEHQIPARLARDQDGSVDDRAAGALLGMACGDALGVPYEYGRAPRGAAQMRGGGLGDYAPGEWSDDTQMAICIARVAATGVVLSSPEGLDAVAAAFDEWLDGNPADIGLQTHDVLTEARRLTSQPAQRMASAAATLHAQTGRTAGNGALMRTAPVALASLEDRGQVAEAARMIAELTHADPLAGDSCVLWSEAVRTAVVECRLDLVSGLDLVPAERRPAWARSIEAAERPAPPADLRRNGFTVTALQAAWRATYLTHWDGIEPSDQVRDALQAAVRIGGDTDTVAAIAGALLGARWGGRRPCLLTGGGRSMDGRVFVAGISRTSVKRSWVGQIPIATGHCVDSRPRSRRSRPTLKPHGCNRPRSSRWQPPGSRSDQGPRLHQGVCRCRAGFRA
ncbi:ADP-ribosylglycohydrolase family protein [Actinotalea sp. K2]|uniref:ADP-ribosylglycohydrolase family protein n=1 Tax=Actinotalea sp. K2 TaxID=2939438 RepID=UPI0020175B7F|nr:ADP-ribosylglycohydrolase family protein [Actinotalea sp. K2]MCL3862940.1 ADP-ribosylglycohydrolase family protein [Actinotalea sp. K2]